MNVEWSGQYQCACVIPGPGDTAQDIIDRCCDIGAIYYENESDDFDYDEMLYVVTLRPDVGPELWTRDALERSMK